MWSANLFTGDLSPFLLPVELSEFSPLVLPTPLVAVADLTGELALSSFVITIGSLEGLPLFSRLVLAIRLELLGVRKGVFPLETTDRARLGLKV